MQANRLVLDVVLAQRGELRFTPAGVPAIEFLLRHASRQPEAGGERRVECEIAGVAFGDVAHRLAATAPGSEMHCEGFLARRWRTGITLALHVDRLTLNDSET